MNRLQSIRWIPRKGRPGVLLLPAALAILFLAVPVCRAPWAARSLLEDGLEAVFGRPAVIGALAFNPFTLRVTASDIRIGAADAGRPVFQLGRLAARLRPTSLLRRVPQVAEIRLTKPVLDLYRRRDGRIEGPDWRGLPARLGNLLTTLSKGSASVPETFRLADGTLRLHDGGRTLVLHHIDVSLPAPEGEAGPALTPRLTATVGAGRLILEGRIRPLPDALQAAFDWHLEDVAIPELAEVRETAPPYRAAAGRLNADGRATLALQQNLEPRLALSGTVTVNGLDIRDPSNRPLLTAEKLTADVLSLDLPARQGHLRTVAVQGALLHLTRLPGGAFGPGSGAPSWAESSKAVLKIDALKVSEGAVRCRDETLAALEPPGPPAPMWELLRLPRLDLHHIYLDAHRKSLTVEKAEAAGGSARVQRLGDGTLDVGPLLSNEGTAWAVGLGEMALMDFDLHTADWPGASGGGLFISPLSVAGIGFTTAPDGLATLEARGGVNGKGDFLASGRVRLAPLTGEFEIRGEDIHLEDLPMPQGPRGVRAAGRLETAGLLSVAAGKPGRGGGAIYRGSLSIQQLKVFGPAAAAPVFSAASVRLAGLDAGYPFNHVIVQTAAVEGFQDRTALEGLDSGWALLRLPISAWEAKGPGGGGPAPGSPQPFWFLDRVRFSDGTMQVTSRSVSPPFTATLTGVRGSITRLGAGPGKPAQITATGRWNGQADLTVDGNWRSVSVDRRAEFRIGLAGLDLKALNPYIEAEMGQRVRSGQLLLKADYTLNGGDLKGTHDITLEDLRLDGLPGASDTQLEKALALLQDRNGRIRMQLPVQERIDAPRSGLMAHLIRSAGEFMAVTAASPFGRLAGRFEPGDFSRLRFIAGSADLTAETLEKLDALSDALRERPWMRIQLTGFVDGVEDPPAVARSRFEERLAAELLPRTPPPARETPAYAAVLWKAYKSAPCHKPRNLIGLVKRLPAEKMEALMMEGLRPSASDLAILAQERSVAVQAYLQSVGKVGRGQIVVGASRTSMAGATADWSGGRVELAIR